MNKFINNKGFVLVETLVVSVFVVTVFTFLYINVIPLIGSYEEEVNYDSIDTKYIGNLAGNNLKHYLNIAYKREIIDAMEATLNDGALYIEISDCDKEITFTDDYDTTRTEPIFGKKENEIPTQDGIPAQDRVPARDETYAQCEEFMSLANVEHIYITKYNLSDIKTAINNTTNNTTNNTDPSVNNLSSQTKEYIKFLPTYENIPSNSDYRLIIALRDSYNNKKLYYGTIEFSFR